MRKDLDNLTAAEMQAMMADMKQVLERRVKQDLGTLRAEIDTKLKAARYSLDEVYSARMKYKADRKLPKYADPANPPLSWSGRGRLPGWLQDRSSGLRPPSYFI